MSTTTFTLFALAGLLGCFGYQSYAQVKSTPTTVISGKVLNYDNPGEIRSGRVYLLGQEEITIGTPPLASKNSRHVDISWSGEFLIETNSNGPHVLLFVIPQHTPLKVYVGNSSKSIKVDVQLSPLIRPNVTPPKVLGSFNNYSITNALEMHEFSPGKYLIDIESKEDTIFYCFTGMNYLTAGNSGQYKPFYNRSLLHDGFISYQITRNGKATVNIDFGSWPRETSARIDCGNEMVAKEAAIYDRISKRFDYVMEMIEKNAEKIDSIKIDFTKEIGVAKGNINASEGILKKLHLIEFLDFRGYNGIGQTTVELDLIIVKSALNEIPPTSPIWNLSLNAFVAAIDLNPDKQAVLSYLQKVSEENPIAKLKSRSLFKTIEILYKRAEDYSVSYQDLMSKYPNSSDASIAKRKFSKESRLIEIGKQIPAFSVKNLRMNSDVFTSKNLAGKYILIDFWATWCGPCIREFPYLKKAYEQFRNSNFEILSISFDSEMGTALNFNSNPKHQLPWLMAIEEKGFRSELAKTFEISAIPFTILIDPNGKILAIDTELRGDNLLGTLEKFVKGN